MATDRPRGLKRPRITLDGQLVTFWDREAARLTALAEATRWRWLARGYARKAERARAKAEVSRIREVSRDASGASPGARQDDASA